eukprot:CAMPEP_0176086952 /NCGR_PEP_ID=MMETSP0120_2-20121206/43527_1 /TAXON_ID=160619 /ORGANISM="Kryptoperidinium foliaceum, Strain CCMP 1326" /LENGTH=389 /DNA_ID=CAMNT_0017420787 /DNA_START=107 /DNA_END=1272 /DNA_ORIENTATION=+
MGLEEVVTAGADTIAGDPLVTDLRHFHPQIGALGKLPEGKLAVVKRIARGVHCDVFRCRWARQGKENINVAGKKVHEAATKCRRNIEHNERSAHLKLGGRGKPCLEDPLTEIGVLQYLAKQPDAPMYLLRMHCAFLDGDSAWLLTEYAEGGDLFDEVSRHGKLPEPTTRRYMGELLQAVAYLHKHRIGHRDISLENVLLKSGTIRLMDFGMAAQSHASCGTPLRYFRATGKDFYRAPECYVPPCNSVEVEVPGGARPGSIASVKTGGGCYCEVLLPKDAVPGGQCVAQVYGYELPPCDVFSVGVCLCIMFTGCPLWGRATLADRRFALALERDVVALMAAWGVEAPSSSLGALMRCTTSPRPCERWSADECLSCHWLADLAGEEELWLR